jgi:hypothetical protein
MKALTLYNPWAFLVQKGLKRNETRNWYPRRPDGIGHSTSTRCATGWFCIHAGLTVDRTAMRRSPIAEALAWHGITADNWSSSPGSMQQRVIVAVAYLERVYETTDQALTLSLTQQERAFGDYSPKRYAWELGAVIELPTAVPHDGRQRLWYVKTVSAIDNVRAQIRRALRDDDRYRTTLAGVPAVDNLGYWL